MLLIFTLSLVSIRHRNFPLETCACMTDKWIVLTNRNKNQLISIIRHHMHTISPSDTTDDK